MKTRVNGSYIYFFMEPNIVFVYNIRFLRYITVRQRNGWETFELEPDEQFDHFNHEEHRPLEGKGYLLSQETINVMVKEINQQIHIQRGIKKGTEEPGDYHLVCSDAAAGSLRVGLERPKKVIGFSGFFSIGPVWKLDDKIGRTNRNEWLLENINFGIDDDYDYENRFSNTLFEIEDIPEHAPIHIWYANNAEEQTGLRFILYLLKNKTNDIVLHNTIELFHSYKLLLDKEEQFLIHSDVIKPEQYKQLFEKEKTAERLSFSEKKQYQQEWETLSQTKEVLRVWENDEMRSVREDYYDSFILYTIEELHAKEGKREFIRTGEVVYQVISDLDQPIGYSFIEFRIRYLIYNGRLDLKGIPKSMHHYSVKLKN